MVLLSSNQWEKRLKDAHGARTGKDSLNGRSSGICLPRSLQVTGTPDLVHIHLNQASITANMQTDAAAFEAWTLALMAWCEVKAVELTWEPVKAEGAASRHYQRFLFRVANFQRWFSTVFSVPGDLLAKELEAARFMTGTDLQVNVAGNRQAMVAAETPPESESEWEKHLMQSPEFLSRFNLDVLDRQFPVGLFAGKPSQESRVFNGGKSAIDLIGVENCADNAKALWLFELKRDSNFSLGILSELLFYVGMMQNLLSPGARFKFADKKPGRQVKVGPAEAKECKRIEACLLADRFHPLLDGVRQPGGLDILGLLNQATASDLIPVNFRKEPVTLVSTS